MQKKYNQSRAGVIFDVFNYIFLILLAVVCVLPMVHLFAISLSSKTAITAGAVGIFTVDASLEAYANLLKESEFFRAGLISVERTVLGVAINMLLTILAAYPLSKSTATFRARQKYVWFFLISMLFTGGMIPTYLIVRYTGLIDTIWSLILPTAVPVFSVILLQNYFKGLPGELSESAQIDGASHWRILFQLYLPLSKPVLAVLVLFSAFNHWNSWVDGMLYINDTTKYPLQTYLQTIVVDVDPTRINSLRDIGELCQENSNAAQVFLSIIPILLIYPFLQKHFANGIVLGAVKG